MTGIKGEPTEFEWNCFFPAFHKRLQLCGKVTDLLGRLGETPENFSQEEFFLSQCSTTFLVTVKAMKEECFGKCPESSSILAKRFGIGQWSFIGPVF